MMINIKYKMIHHIHIKTLATAWLATGSPQLKRQNL